MKTHQHDQSVKDYLASVSEPIAKNINDKFEEQLTLGDRLADKMTGFAGSWPFIILCLSFLFIWIGANIYLLSRPFDPFPFILLNLMLSTIAALQAPIIMMSQNRQALKDRLRAEHDYMVNLKAEAEIAALHKKIDAIERKLR
jgi:uncharacterized membrane protein